MRKVFAAALTAAVLMALFLLPVSADEPELSVSLPVKVTFANGNTDEAFAVTLSADNVKYPMPSGSVDGAVQVSVKANETAYFGEIKYYEPGTYTYTVYQNKAENSGIEYDDTVYVLTVTVIYEDGEYQAVSTVSIKGSDYKTEDVLFQNRPVSPNGEPQLSVVKTANHTGEVSSGDIIEYTFLLTNYGSTPIENIRVRDYIPQGTTYVVGSATGGGIYGRINGRDHITWNIPLLSAGQTMKLSFKVTVDECVPGTGIKNEAYYETDDKTYTNDPDDPDNSTNIVELIVDPPKSEDVSRGYDDFTDKTDSNNSQYDDNDRDNIPGTGDNSTMTSWIVFTVIAAICIVVLSICFYFYVKRTKE